MTLAACKTTRSAATAESPLDALENEEQLPACDDITVGRIYFVQSINKQMQCVEGGAWQPREIEVENQENPASGSRSIP
jgi:hypothetical protein